MLSNFAHFEFNVYFITLTTFTLLSKLMLAIANKTCTIDIMKHQRCIFHVVAFKNSFESFLGGLWQKDNRSRTTPRD